MEPRKAYRTNFMFDGRTLYRIEGEKHRFFILQTYGEIAASLRTAAKEKLFTFDRCPAAEEELENMEWVPLETVEDDNGPEPGASG